jgi:hypothetical protein
MSGNAWAKIYGGTTVSAYDRYRCLLDSANASWKKSVSPSTNPMNDVAIARKLNPCSQNVLLL